MHCGLVVSPFQEQIKTPHGSWLTVYNSLSEANFFLCLAVMPSLIIPLRKASPEPKVTHAIPELPVNSVPCLSQSYPGLFRGTPSRCSGRVLSEERPGSVPSSDPTLYPEARYLAHPPTYQMAIYGRENQEGV